MLFCGCCLGCTSEGMCGFPMSQYLKDQACFCGRNARMSACLVSVHHTSRKTSHIAHASSTTSFAYELNVATNIKLHLAKHTFYLSTIKLSVHQCFNLSLFLAVLAHVKPFTNSFFSLLRLWKECLPEEGWVLDCVMHHINIHISIKNPFPLQHLHIRSAVSSDQNCLHSWS